MSEHSDAPIPGPRTLLEEVRAIITSERYTTRGRLAMIAEAVAGDSEDLEQLLRHIYSTREARAMVQKKRGRIVDRRRRQ
jgi:hypothetical protein